MQVNPHVDFEPVAPARGGRRDLRTWLADGVLSLRERTLWPLRDRIDLMGPLGRGLAVAVAVALIAGAGVAAWLLSSSGDPGSEATRAAVQTPSPAPAAVPVSAPSEPRQSPQATLHGAAPDFGPSAAAKGNGSGPASAGATTAAAATSAAAGTKVASASATGADASASAAEAASSAKGGEAAAKAEAKVPGAPAGPLAVATARRFATAFVLYETGVRSAKVRAAFRATASPQLRRSLLQRPPRLPADVTVPRARVLNVVPGPSRAGVFPVSVSLLRAKLTSELRLDLEPGPGRQDRWQVTDVLG